MGGRPRVGPLGIGPTLGYFLSPLRGFQSVRVCFKTASGPTAFFITKSFTDGCGKLSWALLAAGLIPLKTVSGQRGETRRIIPYFLLSVFLELRVLRGEKSHPPSW
jgi:hypothetical protein